MPGQLADQEASRPRPWALSACWKIARPPLDCDDTISSVLLASNSAASKLCAPLRSFTPISPCTLFEGFSAKLGPGALLGW